MSIEVSSYSAQNVSINWLGHQFQGFADGDDTITIERSEKTMTKLVGMQGDGVFVQSADHSGMITIRLLQNSETNKFLTLKQAATEAGVIASGPFIMVEAGSDARASCMRTALEGVPSMVRGAGANTVEWTFLSMDITIGHGFGVRVN
jgi:hypothetical protein